MSAGTADMKDASGDGESRPVLTFDDVSFQYPGARAPVIEHLSLQVSAGSFVAVLGGSGVGKSTLLRSAAGLIGPASGRVLFDEARRQGRRQRAMVFQDSRLMPWRRVAGNVSYGLEGLGLARAERHQRIADALRLTGLAELAARWPHQLSGGQAQRAGIARALAVQPDLLLMDEPFSAVDAITRAGLQAELVRVWQASSAAVLFVTHDIDEAVFLADQVIVLTGSPARVSAVRDIHLERPRVRTSAAFADLKADLLYALSGPQSQAWVI